MTPCEMHARSKTAKHVQGRHEMANERGPQRVIQRNMDSPRDDRHRGERLLDVGSEAADRAERDCVHSARAQEGRERGAGDKDMKQPGLPEERAAIRGRPSIYTTPTSTVDSLRGGLRRGADGHRRFASRDTHTRLQQAPVQARRRF